MKSIQPQNGKWTGTVDYAVARFNTALLKLINEPLKMHQYKNEIDECHRIIGDFVKNIRRYNKWPIIAKWIPGIMIYYIGKRKIPRIKKFLNNIND